MTPNPSNNPTKVSRDSSAVNHDPMIRGLALGCMILLAVIAAVSLLVIFKFQNFVQYGLVVRVQNLDSVLERDRALEYDQYKELKTYLHSITLFVKANPMDKLNLVRYRMATDAFRNALQDGRIERGELETIRAVMNEAKIPLAEPQNLSR